MVSFAPAARKKRVEDTLARMPSAQLHHSRTKASCACLTTHSPGSSRRRAAATPFFETRTLCRTLLALRGSLSQFMRPPHAPTPRSAVLQSSLLWLPAAPHCLSCPFLSGPCSLQSLPTRLLSSVGVRCCLSISISVSVSLSLSLSLSLCLVSCVLCLVSFVLCLCLCRVYAFVCVCDCVCDCVLRLVSGSGSGSVSESFL